MKTRKSKKELEVFMPELTDNRHIPFSSSVISAGFPSPADDYMEQTLDLNQLLIRHPSATFYIRAKGNSMINAGIYDGDILIVDRSLLPANKSVVIGVIDGEFTVKRISKEKEKLFLIPENDEYKHIEVNPDTDLKIWGVVTHVIHKVQ
jgi:DNA polymerase V